MHKTLIAIPVIFIAAISCTDETPPEVFISYPSENAELSGIVTVRISASDDEEMHKVELYKNGYLLDTRNYETDGMYSFDWDTDDEENGQFSLFAKAYDVTGNFETSDIVNVRVMNYRTITFQNTTWDVINFTFYNTSAVIEYYDIIEIQVPKNLGNTNFSGYAGGTCGRTISWDFNVDVGTIDETWSLWVNSDYFYLFLENQTSVDISHSYINQDIVSGEDYCGLVPNDGQLYSLGYFKAYPNSNLYCYLSNHPQYISIYWDPIVLPGEDNQYFYGQTGFFKFGNMQSRAIPDPSFEKSNESLGGGGMASKEFVPMIAPPFDLNRIIRK